MTNYERIKAMSVEEMASFLAKVQLKVIAEVVRNEGLPLPDEAAIAKAMERDVLMFMEWLCEEWDT